MVAEDIELAAPAPIVFVLMVRERPVLSPGLARFCGLALRFDAALEAAVEEMPVTDARMAQSFPGSLYRLTFTGVVAGGYRGEFVFVREGS